MSLQEDVNDLLRRLSISVNKQTPCTSSTATHQRRLLEDVHGVFNKHPLVVEVRRRLRDTFKDTIDSQLAPHSLSRSPIEPLSIAHILDSPEFARFSLNLTSEIQECVDNASIDHDPTSSCHSSPCSSINSSLFSFPSQDNLEAAVQVLLDASAEASQRRVAMDTLMDFSPTELAGDSRLWKNVQESLCLALETHTLLESALEMYTRIFQTGSSDMAVSALVSLMEAMQRLPTQNRELHDCRALATALNKLQLELARVQARVSENALRSLATATLLHLHEVLTAPSRSLFACSDALVDPTASWFAQFLRCARGRTHFARAIAAQPSLRLDDSLNSILRQQHKQHSFHRYTAMIASYLLSYHHTRTVVFPDPDPTLALLVVHPEALQVIAAHSPTLLSGQHLAHVSPVPTASLYAFLHTLCQCTHGRTLFLSDPAHFSLLHSPTPSTDLYCVCQLLALYAPAPLLPVIQTLSPSPDTHRLFLYIAQTPLGARLLLNNSSPLAHFTLSSLRLIPTAVHRRAIANLALYNSGLPLLETLLKECVQDAIAHATCNFATDQLHWLCRSVLHVHHIPIVSSLLHDWLRLDTTVRPARDNLHLFGLELLESIVAHNTLSVSAFLDKEWHLREALLRQQRDEIGLDNRVMVEPLTLKRHSILTRLYFDCADNLSCSESDLMPTDLKTSLGHAESVDVIEIISRVRKEGNLSCALIAELWTARDSVNGPILHHFNRLPLHSQVTDTPWKTLAVHYRLEEQLNNSPELDTVHMGSTVDQRMRTEFPNIVTLVESTGGSCAVAAARFVANAFVHTEVPRSLVLLSLVSPHSFHTSLVNLCLEYFVHLAGPLRTAIGHAECPTDCAHMIH